MRKLIIVNLIIALTLALTLTSSVADETGGLALEFLSFGAGARSLGMGKAYVAIADEASATYWNQAGLTQLQQPEFTTLYTTLFMDTSYSFVSYAHPTTDWGTFGINAVMLSSGNFEKVNATNEVIGTFSDQQMSVGLSYGRRLTDTLAFGAGVNYISRALDDSQDSIISTDISCLYNPTAALSVGFTVKNAVSTVIDGDTKDVIEPDFRLGAAYRLFDDDLLVSADISRMFDESMKVHGGIEYKLWGDMLVLRAGADATEITGGLGLNLGEISVDYAYAQQELGDSHRFSFSYKFGGTTVKSRAEKAAELMKKSEKSYRSGNYNKAFDQIREALKIYPEGKDEQLLKKKLTRVLNVLRKQKGPQPFGTGDTSKQLKQATKEYLDHDLYTAKDRLEYVLSTEPDNALAQDMLAQVESTLDESGNKDQSPIQKKLEKVLNLFYEGEYDKVITECKKIIAIEPNTADAYKKMGSAYYMKKMMNEAIEAWKVAVQLDPKDTKLKNFLDQLILSQKNSRAKK